MSSFFEARVGFEPALRVLQTHALPLGYLAIDPMFSFGLPIV